MIPAGFNGRVSFGPFLLDGGTRELRRGVDPIHLTPKAFELLSALIEQRPRAVTKAALYERLWPNAFVDEANLAILVGEIRGALRDSARMPTYIRTVHGFGYAFCGHAFNASALPAVSPTVGSTCWLVSKTRHVSLHEGENIVGRDPSSEVWLDAHSISRRHARIVVSGDKATVEDTRSKNGSWLNRRRIEATEPLTDGDQLMFGSVAMTFRIWFDGGSTETTSLSR
jgi:DNA-binding winged helix-turn-helix (wHTH) protein